MTDSGRDSGEPSDPDVESSTATDLDEEARASSETDEEPPTSAESDEATSPSGADDRSAVDTSAPEGEPGTRSGSNGRTSDNDSGLGRSAGEDGRTTDPGVTSSDRRPADVIDGRPANPPPPANGIDRDVPSPTEHPIRWYLNSSNGLVVVSRDLLISLAVVTVLGLVLFGLSGVWPPLVAVESGSMQPNMHPGDLVVIVDSDRYAGDLATEHGIVTRERGASAGHESFNEPGNVIVFQPNGGDGTPIIHRAEFYVEEDENWVQRAEPEYLNGETCEDLPQDVCPAPHDGYVTKGDNNGGYDPIQGQSTVVKSEWIQGKAVVRIPYLGCIRLAFESGPGCW